MLQTVQTGSIPLTWVLTGAPELTRPRQVLKWPEPQHTGSASSPAALTVGGSLTDRNGSAHTLSRFLTPQLKAIPVQSGLTVAQTEQLTAQPQPVTGSRPQLRLPHPGTFPQEPSLFRMLRALFPMQEPQITCIRQVLLLSPPTSAAISSLALILMPAVAEK